MFMASIVSACAAIILIAHCVGHGPDLLFVLSCVMRGPRASPTKSQELLDVAIWDIRIKHFISAARVYVHVTAVATIGLVCAMFAQPTSMPPLQVSMALLGWIQHHVVATETLTMNKARMRLLVLLHYVQCGAFVYGLPSDCEHAILTSALVLTIRFTISLLSADIGTAVPAQALFMMHEIWIAWKRDPSTATTVFWYQLIASSAILAVSGLVEFSTRSRIAMLLNSESMVVSFRQMLRGLCDGELLLDGNLRVVGKVECLRRLLMTSDDFSNQSFEELLVEEERPRFLRFMFENLESTMTGADDNKLMSAPPCLRVSLKGAGHRIGVDLFHVKMPPLFGQETYHLVALREDSDFRQAAEAFAEAAPDSTPALPQIEEKGTKTAGVGSSVARSDRSVPQVSSNSLIQICPELQEMTLLVDASTPLLDVEQAHLSFVRRGDEFDCSMPSLRRIVRPTDWGTVRSDLREFALTAGSMQSAAQQKDVLKTKLRLQDDAKRCVEARDVQVSAFSPPASAGGSEPMLRKLCLQIGGLRVVDKPKPRCELQGVHECQSDESEGDLSEVSAL
ncbi:unnamed protein product [Cladocopium goreaui]|uniref:Ion transport domain-containing protein n=1 Tax=Cladocopium goreaui TaxID=2562237 RepID=A0A9P1BMS5_9DINO|nr:unnamed protein product [Cladocopium goreaui]CAI3976198.1 unnamed protein product [Cladocopium goreaui]